MYVLRTFFFLNVVLDFSFEQRKPNVWRAFCITIIMISDEDYVDALVLSQQNGATSSLLDLAIVEVSLHLLIMMMTMTMEVTKT